MTCPPRWGFYVRLLNRGSKVGVVLLWLCGGIGYVYGIDGGLQQQAVS